MIKQAIQFVESHPRMILMMGWPVLVLILIGLIMIVWHGPWIVAAAIQLKQLDILASLSIGVLVLLGLNQFAQSSGFFEKFGLKVGQLIDLDADMNDDEEKSK